MNRNIILLPLVFALSGCVKSERTEQSITSPEPNVVEIAISAPSMWLLRIEQDGSGQVGFGQVGTDFAHFPAGTLDFASLREHLRAICVTTGSISRDFSVAFRGEGVTSTTAQYFSDTELARELYAKAVKKSDKTGTRVEELYTTRPPVPHNRDLKATGEPAP